MELRLTKPAHEEFINNQLKTGQYSSAEAVIEDILDFVINDTLTAEDIAAIEESESQIERGECVDLTDFAAAYRKRHGLPQR